MKWISLLFILTTGLSLRLVGANWGFPMLLHPDEHGIAGVPVEMAVRSSFDPGVYMHPDHLDVYANAAIYHVASSVRFGKPLKDTFGAHTTFYYLLSRIFTALLGAACIWVAYLIGKEYGEGTAIVAAILFAIFPSYVGHSHYITSDIPLTLCVLLAILFAAKYLRDPATGNLMALSLVSACAVSIKYPGALVVVLTATVIAWRYHTDKKKVIVELSKACLLFLLCVFLISPYLFINYQQVFQALLREARPSHLGADGLGWSGNLLYYAKSYLSFSGPVLFFFFLLGAVSIIKTERSHAIPLFFGFFYWLLLGKVQLHWERWALPMYASPLLLTAYGVDSVYRRTLVAANSYVAPAYRAAMFLIFARLLVVSAVVAATFTLEDTRNVSSDFVRRMGMNDANTLYEGYTPLCPASARSVFVGPDVIENARFIVLSSYMYNRYRNERSRYVVENKFYDEVFALPLVKQFSPAHEGDFADSSFWANRDLGKALAFLEDYWRNRDELLSGPTIRIHQLQH